MSQHPSDTEEQTSAPAGPGPGEALMQARRQRGLSVEQVAAELNVQTDKLEALERDDYDRLTSPVFVRGYLRNYARLVGLDGDELVSQYQQRDGTDEPPIPVNDSLNVNMSKGHSPWPARIALIVVIIALWSLAHWYFVGRTATEAPSEVSAAQSSVSSAAAELQAEPGASVPGEAAEPAPASDFALDMADSEPETGTRDPAARTNELPAAQADGQIELSTEPAPAEPGLDRLVLQFENDCWVEVRDDAGDALAADLQRGGSELALAGQAPFRVKLGDPGGVSVTLNGEAVDVPSAAAGSVVNFDVGE